MKLSSLELFSGAGGLAKGLELAGFNHAAFVEFNKHACNTLRANFDAEKVFFGDAREFDFSTVSHVDLIAGGPPCQPFSIGGKHRASEDQRDMFPLVTQAIETLQPRAFIFENVKGLLRPTFKEYFEYILLRLTYPDCRVGREQTWQAHLKKLREIKFRSYAGTKYVVSHKLINAANYGVPQTRERVFIVGIRDDLKMPWAFPDYTHSQESLMWDQFVTGEYWSRHGVQPPRDKRSKELIEKTRRQLGFLPPSLKPWRTIRDELADTPDPASNHGIPDHIFRDGARSYAGHTGSELDSAAKTIKAGVHGVPGGENMIHYPDGSIRYLTVHEGKLLQTFPPEFMICGGWGEGMRQIGNAVPVLVASKLGKALYPLIDKAAAPRRGTSSEQRERNSRTPMVAGLR